MDVIMPQLGETVAEGTVTVWHKKVGDAVKADELLFEIGTDKVEMEIPAPAAGVLAEILVGEGDTVDVGTKLAVIQVEGEAAPPPKAKTAKTAAPEQAKRSKREKKQKAAPGDARLSPVVRKLLDEHGLDAGDIDGTGRDGRITRGDVLARVEASGGGAGTSKSTPGAKTVPFSYLRKVTAEHMVRSKATSAHVLQAVEADYSAVEAARAAHGGPWEKAEGYPLSYLPFVAKAVCEAITDFPRINAHVEGSSLVVFEAVNLGIAVDLNFDGLVAPVVKGASAMRVPGLARAIHDLAARARDGKLKPDDLTGGTYTISNSGSFGTLITAPIINQPQAAILSTDGVQKKPVVIETKGGDEIQIRPIGVLAQSFDHRAFDGAYSAAFLKRLKEIIETRDWAKDLA